MSVKVVTSSSILKITSGCRFKMTINLSLLVHYVKILWRRSKIAGEISNHEFTRYYLDARFVGSVLRLSWRNGMILPNQETVLRDENQGVWLLFLLSLFGILQDNRCCYFHIYFVSPAILKKTLFHRAQMNILWNIVVVENCNWNKI